MQFHQGYVSERYDDITYNNNNQIVSFKSYVSGEKIERISYEWDDNIIYCLHEIYSSEEWEVYKNYSYELNDSGDILKK